MVERVNYNELKEWFLDDAYIWCQRKFEDGKIKKWHKGESEWGGAMYSFENSFETPIENLMLNVIYIIVNGARHELSHKIVFNDIQEILFKNDLNELIKDLGEEERKDFLYDLNLILNNREME